MPTTPHLPNLKPGDTIQVRKETFGRSRISQLETWTVSKVGSKWVTANPENFDRLNARFSIANGWMDAGAYASDLRAYLSAEAALAADARLAAWLKLRRAAEVFHYTPPDHLTTERIEAIFAEIRGETPTT